MELAPRPPLPHAHSSDTTHGHLSYTSAPAPYTPAPAPFAPGTFLLQCLVTPLLGLGFAALGFYILYAPAPPAIAHSTAHIAAVSQGLTVLLVLWTVLALAPALGVADAVRTEEWWRRLTRGTTFARANAVSSNIGGGVARAREMLLGWTSRYYKAACAAALLAAVLADIAPGAIHVQSGWRASGAAPGLTVPALPAGSIWDRYDEPFAFTNDTQHASIDLAPVYYAAVAFGGMLPDVVPGALVPRPNAPASTGYRYTTDVVLLNYTCEWLAPEIPEPDPAVVYDEDTAVPFSVGGITGTGSPPFAINDVYPLQSFVNTSTGAPSFDGYLAFVVSSGTPPPSQLPALLNLSAVPAYTPSPAWQAASAAWRKNLTFAYAPATALSVALCTPQFTIESWEIDLANGTVQSYTPQKTRLGNLDKTQVGLAITDAFNTLASTPPFSAWYPAVSTAQLSTLFALPLGADLSSPLSPLSGAAVGAWMNGVAIPSAVQAYFDGAPFGSAGSPGAKTLAPALVLTAQREFVYITTGLYALLTAALWYLHRRPPAQPLALSTVRALTHTSQSPRFANAVSGRAAAALVEAAGATEPAVAAHLSAHSALLFPDAQNRAVLELCPPLHPPAPARPRGGVPYLWVLTPLLGAGLVGLGIVGYVRPRTVGGGGRAGLYAALFTWALGVWRSAALLGVGALVRQGNSDEWSRMLSKHGGAHLSKSVDTLSSNTLSPPAAFRAAWRTHTSIAFKTAYLAALAAALCGVVAQSMLALVPLPSSSPAPLAVPLLDAAYVISEPWSADVALAPGNYYFTQIGKLATYLAHLEQAAGVRVSDAQPPGFVVPRLNNTNSAGEPGWAYPTDVMRVRCACEWVAPLLPEATNASYIPVGLGSVGIVGVQTGPHGIATFAPVSNMTYVNGTAVTSGLFAWTMWGGGPGAPVNLDSVPYTNLSAAWQDIIAREIVPAYLANIPGDRPYITNLTRVSTLVCDPQLRTLPAVATAYNGAIQLDTTSSTKAVGNIVGDFATYLVYNFAAEQALSLLGIFRPYLLFGLATGNAVFDADPANAANGVVPKPLLEIASNLDAYIASGSKAWTHGNGPSETIPVSGAVIKPALVMVAGLPWVVAAAVLFFALGCMGLVIARRRMTAPFTLAGILMMSAQLEAMQFDGGEKDEGRVKDVDGADSQ
ncbi:hypothetical protein HWV62_28106 [Athelia sp. TMB]|nr:hypothetical protein HWV62_28106 [Athelia sp. TMB]